MYENGSSSLLPFDYTDTGFNVFHFLPDATDLKAGTVRNRVNPSTVLIAENGAYLEEREGYETGYIVGQDDTSGGAWSRILTTDPQFDVVNTTSNEGCIWEAVVMPDVLPSASGADSAMGDSVNRLEMYNDAGSLKCRFNIASGAVIADSGATNLMALDTLVHMAGINTGDTVGGSNIYAAVDGIVGAAQTRATDALSTGIFSHGNHNAPASDVGWATMFKGKSFFFRIWKIHKDYMPTIAEIQRALQFHRRSFEPGNNPGEAHPIFAELLEKRVNGAIVCRVATWTPGNIITTSASAGTWAPQLQNTVTAPASFPATTLYSEGQRDFYMDHKGYISRRVIYVGDPAGTAPTGTKGVATIEAGAAAGPYAGATAVADALAVAVPTDIARRVGNYSYSGVVALPPTVAIASVSLTVDGLTTIVTTTAHKLSTGMTAKIRNVLGGTFGGSGFRQINANHVATVVDPTTFTIPTVNCTVQPTANTGEVWGIGGRRGRHSRFEAPVVADIDLGSVMATSKEAAYCDVIGGVYTNGAGDGLAIAAQAKDSVFEKLVANGSTGDGVDVATGATGNVFNRNILRGNGGKGIRSDEVITVTNNIVLGNATGSINAPASILKHNNLNVAAAGGADSSVNSDHNIIGHTPKFYDVDAGNQNLGHMKQSNTVHSGEGGVDQGPFNYNENPKWIMHIGGILYLVEGAGIVKKI